MSDAVAGPGVEHVLKTDAAYMNLFKSLLMAAVGLSATFQIGYGSS